VVVVVVVEFHILLQLGLPHRAAVAQVMYTLVNLDFLYMDQLSGFDDSAVVDIHSGKLGFSIHGLGGGSSVTLPLSLPVSPCSPSLGPVSFPLMPVSFTITLLVSLTIVLLAIGKVALSFFATTSNVVVLDAGV
jgi:hypothetical protein